MKEITKSEVNLDSKEIDTGKANDSNTARDLSGDEVKGNESRKALPKSEGVEMLYLGNGQWIPKPTGGK